MIQSKFKLSLALLLAGAMAVLPTATRAQGTNQPALEKKEKDPKAKKPAVTPFHGKLKAVDKVAKTISVGEMTIQITSETKIVKIAKDKTETPAMLEDGVVSENVSGAYKKSADGKLDATKVTFGSKEEPKEPKPKKEKTTTTN